MIRKLTWGAWAALMAVVLAGNAQAAVLYSNGFEIDTLGWPSPPTRVSSGTGGITSSSGSFHATTTGSTGSLTDWGGYNFGAGNAVPTSFQEYWTAVDIYLNVSGGWANDTRFDFTSAINNAGGTHLRDFAFNAGFYNDGTGPGANTSRFIVSASNNTGRANSFPKNSGRDPFAISTTGWYTFQHHFYNNSGVLAVDLSILNAANTVVHSWTLSSATDLIGGVGGNRYGWLLNNEFSTLAIDNSELIVADVAAVPEPASLALFGLGGLGLLCGRIRRRKQIGT